MKHVRGAPMHPRAEGKVERWHQTLKSRIPLGNDFLEEDLKAAIAALIELRNTRRYRERVGSLAPADVCRGCVATIPAVPRATAEARSPSGAPDAKPRGALGASSPGW